MVMRQAHIRVMHEAPKTKLAAWMAKNGHKDQWLADRLKCSQPQAWRIRAGVSRTSPERAFAIEKLTRGAVKASALLTEPLAPANDPSPSQEAAA